ncbi:hypothetical protein Cni_G19611 [Canna indica]|uniref:Zinc finger PMZ-type domain-containing protein n=1 Tax=Canna indica TaxID=4628 RepID=A0AAQ3KNG4_9LILI|nr:hypothetical protein Cni_G19611 [Canna indica]
MTAWTVKDVALKKIHGNGNDQYKLLYKYRAELMRTNSGTNVKFRWKRGKWKGIYVCLKALKEAFKAGCRRIVCIDGCFLKGPYPRKLFSVVGIDSNDCIFSIAYALVDTKSTATWTWFIENLIEDLEMHYRGPRVQVAGMGTQFIIDLNDRTSTCRAWKLSGLPCIHTIVATYQNNEEPESYVDECYHVSTYQRVLWRDGQKLKN